MADKKLVALKPFLNGAGNRVKRGQPLDPDEYDPEILKHYIGLGMAGDKASLAPAEPTGTAAKKSAAAAKKIQDAEAKKAKKAEKAEADKLAAEELEAKKASDAEKAEADKLAAEELESKKAADAADAEKAKQSDDESVSGDK